MKLKDGDRVTTIVDNEIVEGVIECVINNMIIVKLDNGHKVKCAIDTVAPVRRAEIKSEEKNEPVEKSEITITPDEFRNIGIDLIMKIAKEKPIVGVAFTAFLANLHKALFFDDVSENS